MIPSDFELIGNKTIKDIKPIYMGYRQKYDLYANYIPVFKSANMSFSINMFQHLLKEIAPKLKDTDIEIIETHHNRKIDSPSGTAQMFADCINEALGNKYHCEYNRQKKKKKRDKYEIGMNSIRGGNIVGEHIVQFFGEEVKAEYEPGCRFPCYNDMMHKRRH